MTKQNQLCGKCVGENSLAHNRALWYYVEVERKQEIERLKKHKNGDCTQPKGIARERSPSSKIRRFYVDY